MEERFPHFKAQLWEIYKKIKWYRVVETGTVVVDTDAEQSGIIFWVGTDNEAYLFSNPTSDDVSTACFMMDDVFSEGIRIGIRESLRLAKEHLNIRENDPVFAGRSSALETFCESLEYLYKEVGHHGLEAEIIEPVTFCHKNPHFDPENPETHEQYEGWFLDISLFGNNKMFDFSSEEKFIETLDAFWVAVRDSKKKSSGG